jgi:hypothetical protein
VLALSLTAGAAFALVGAPPPWAGHEWIFSGRVLTTDPGTSSFVVRGEEITKTVTYSTETTVYGYRERGYITGADIFSRDLVHVDGTETAPGQLAATYLVVIHPPANVTGRITAIDTAGKVITVYKNKRWPAVPVHYTDGTKVVLPGRGLKAISDLTVGMRIKVWGYRKGAQAYATWIRIIRPFRQGPPLGGGPGGPH